MVARLADLDAGDIETLVAETDRLRPQLSDDTARDTAKALAYFKTNAHRMRYHYFREHGLFVRSGAAVRWIHPVMPQMDPNWTAAQIAAPGVFDLGLEAAPR